LWVHLLLPALLLLLLLVGRRLLLGQRPLLLLLLQAVMARAVATIVAEISLILVSACTTRHDTHAVWTWQ
jgi:hypothetical protein